MNLARQVIRSMFSKQVTQREMAPAFSSLEALEVRVFLSGTVRVSVVDGTLNIQGDSAINLISLDQSGLNAGQVRIAGFDGTAINKHGGSVVVSGVTHDLVIRMGGGTDTVTMSNLVIPGNVSVNAQDGADTLAFNHVKVGLSLGIRNSPNLGTTTTIANTTVGRNLVILGGKTIAMQGVAVKRDTQIVGGRGSDVLQIDDSVFHGDVSLATGRGADVVQIESHGDPLGPPTQFDKRVAISLGGGNDSLQLGVAGQTGNRSVFAGKVCIDGEEGNDTLFDGTTYLANSQFRIRNFESYPPTADTIAPTVSSTSPADHATGVALNRKIAATFSEAMDPLSITAANVTVMAPGSVSVPGVVAYVGTTMTFTPTNPLASNTLYTATITTGAIDLAGNSLANDFTWTFTTGATTDTTAPTVISTDPATVATGIALNKKITATFSEAMDPLTITTASYTLTGPGSTSVLGTVSYVSNTATFTPHSNLAANTTYTATLTTGAADLAGNALATNKVWTFTTGATADTTAPTVTSTSPADLKTNVALNKSVSATFSEAIDPLTLTTATYTITGLGNTAVLGTVNYDAPSKIATFVPSGNLAANTSYTATLIGGVNGVSDLAGNPMAADKVWTFTTGTQVAQNPINLGAAGAFAVMATASISGTGNTINGDVGLNPGSAQGIPPSEVNGTIHVDDQAVIDAQADLLAAYNDAVSRSVTSLPLPGNMGGLTFTPGLYTNSTSVLIQGSGPNNNVTLDAQGDPNAIFIFKMGSTLTTAAGAHVILAGGAKASNVFWQVGTSATLNTTTIFKGSIIAAVTITVNNGSAVEGRLLGGSSSAGSVTVNGSAVTVPAT